jgi:hypothetical protein
VLPPTEIESLCTIISPGVPITTGVPPPIGHHTHCCFVQVYPHEPPTVLQVTDSTSVNTPFKSDVQVSLVTTALLHAFVDLLANCSFD